MSDGILNKTGQLASDVAKKAAIDAAKIVAEETNEVLRSAGQQLVGVPTEAPRAEVGNTASPITPYTQGMEADKVNSKRIINGLQVELAEIARKKRMEQLKEANQEELIKKQQSEKGPAPLIQMSSHRSRDPKEQGVKREQNRVEWSKQVNG